MSESGKITSSHLSRAALIYVRQSTLMQVERNTESTARQYDLVNRARQLGWPREAIRVVDGDLGISGSVTGQRAGFEGLVAEVALGQVGIILALEASRLARDNAAWYRLLDLAGVCDTLVADANGVYHPALFTDRLVLGLMGIMAESELHVLRARLEGGIKNKAARGELRRGLPVGLIWGEGDGEICFHPDEAVTGVLSRTFERFAVSGSVRATWLWLRAQGLRWPLQQAPLPARQARRDHLGRADLPCRAHHADPPGLRWRLRLRPHPRRTLPRPGRRAAPAAPQAAPRPVGGPHPRSPPRVHRLGHLPGQPGPHRRQHPAAARRPGTGAVREGCALLQGLATCGTCGRKLADLLPRPGQTRAELLLPGLRELVNGRGSRHMNTGGQGIDAAVAEAFLAALPPAALQACLPPPSNSSTATTRRWTSTAARSSRPATRPSRPSAATARSTRRTGWSPAAWKPTGTPRSAARPTPKPSSPAARPPGRRP